MQSQCHFKYWAGLRTWFANDATMLGGLPKWEGHFVIGPQSPCMEPYGSTSAVCIETWHASGLLVPPVSLVMC